MIIPELSDVDTVLRFPTLLDVASKSTKTAVLETHPEFIRYMKAPPKEYQLLVIHKDADNIKYINNPCDDVVVYATIFGTSDEVNTTENITNVLDRVLNMMMSKNISKWKILKLVYRMLFKKSKRK